MLVSAQPWFIFYLCNLVDVFTLDIQASGPLYGKWVWKYRVVLRITWDNVYRMPGLVTATSIRDIQQMVVTAATIVTEEMIEIWYEYLWKCSLCGGISGTSMEAIKNNEMLCFRKLIGQSVRKGVAPGEIGHWKWSVNGLSKLELKNTWSGGWAGKMVRKRRLGRHHRMEVSVYIKGG